MSILLDTSVLVAAMVETHPAYESAFPYLPQMRNGKEKGYAAAHSLAEIFAVLTRLPVKPRISPALAHKMIQKNVIENCAIIPLNVEDYRAVIKHLSKQGLSRNNFCLYSRRIGDACWNIRSLMQHGIRAKRQAEWHNYFWPRP